MINKRLVIILMLFYVFSFSYTPELQYKSTASSDATEFPATSVTSDYGPRWMPTGYEWHKGIDYGGVL